MTYSLAARRILTKIAFAAFVATRLAVEPAQAAQCASELHLGGKGTHAAGAVGVDSIQRVVGSLEALRVLGLVRPTRALP